MLALLAVVACSPAPPSPPELRPLEPAIRLVDEARGGRERDAVPSVEIDGVRRPVLARSAAVAVGKAQGAPGGQMTVAVRPPADAAGSPLRLTTSGGNPASAAAIEPRVLAAGTAASNVKIVLVGSGPDTMITVMGRPAPAATHTTPAVQIPERALLRFAIGLDEQEWPDGLAPILFRVAVVSEGRDEVVFERTLDPSDPLQRGWLESEVDLARFAGKPTSFRFATEAGPAPGGLFTFPVWGDPTILVRSTKARPRPNFLLMSLDTLRVDHVGAYGYARPTTPTIDTRLAGRGTLFERAYSAYPSTPGSHMTLFTALPTCVHGVSGTSLDARLALDITTLPELFREAGYATAAFVENAWVTHSLGFSRGFETWVENTSPDLTAPIGQAEKTFAETAAWIDAHRDQPWLVFAHTYQVHHPYAPPTGYVEQVAANPGETAAEQEKARYDGEIRYTDDLVAKLLDAMDASGVLRNTVVVLFSDHGEHFGEHGQHRHGFSLYEELLHVPLILYGPGVVPEGKRITAEVGLIDVLPTMLELAGIAPLADRQGTSLTPLLRGESLPARTLFAELPLLGLVAARRDGRKVVVDTKQRRAWATDLSIDPREAASAPSFDAPETIAWLAEFERTCASRRVDPARSATPTEGVDPDVQEKLRALGYTE